MRLFQLTYVQFYSLLINKCVLMWHVSWAQKFRHIILDTVGLIDDPNGSYN